MTVFVWEYITGKLTSIDFALSITKVECEATEVIIIYSGLGLVTTPHA